MIRITTDAALVTDVELKFAPNGKAYARMRAVSKERRKDAQGQWVDGDETFFSVTVFGKPAEMLAETNPSKGTRLLIVGKAKMESWEDRNGVTRSGLSVVADSISLDLLFTAYDKRGERRSAPAGQAAADDGWGSQSYDTYDEPPF